MLVTIFPAWQPAVTIISALPMPKSLWVCLPMPPSWPLTGLRSRAYRFPGPGVLRHRPSGIPLSRLSAHRAVYSRGDETAGPVFYTGLLSAAQFHGAAHHRPQEYQVMVAKSRRPIVCGAVRVAFVMRKNISERFRCRASIRRAARFSYRRPRRRLAVTCPLGSGHSGRAGPRYLPGISRDLFPSRSVGSTRVSGRHGALQTLPQTGRALHRGHRPRADAGRACGAGHGGPPVGV
jgi:hypothetical protein